MKKRAVVVGAGIAGLTSAYYLAKAGYKVTVYEQERYPAMRCSHANGGQISVSNSEVWNTWTNVNKGLKWMFTKDAPLLIRPRFDPAMFSWITKFLWHTARGDYKKNTEWTIRTGIESSKLYKQIITEEKLEFDQTNSGILHFYKNGEYHDRAYEAAKLFRKNGCEWENVTAGYLYVNGGNGSTSGGNGGNAGGFISNGGSATNGVSGVAGGILNLSASSKVSISGSITWGNGSILTIPAITGTLVTTTGSTSYSGSTGSVTPINVQDGLLGAGVLVQSATNFVMSGSASITGNLGLSGSLTLGIGSTVDSFVGNIISGQSAVVLESTIPENGGVEGGIIITNQNSNSNKWLFQAVYADDGGDNGMVFTAAGNGSAYGGNGYADGDIVFKANDSTVCRFQSSSSSGGYGSPIVMKDDGSISWGNANGLLGSDGSLTVGNGSGVANINASDGSASFASGNIFFKASPVELDFSVGGSQKFSLGYDSTHITFYNNSGSFGFMVWDSGELSVGTDFYTPTNNPCKF